MKNAKERRTIILGGQQWHGISDAAARELVKKLIDASCWYITLVDEP